MTADRPFRVSTYLTLALARAALGVTEGPVLPEVGAFAGVIVVTLALLYRLESRVELLSIPAANNLGVGIALAAAAWAGARIVHEVRTGAFASLGWGVFFVLLLAPVLMAGMVGKLLRKEKDAGDYWYLHAAGLAAVVLAGAIARRPWEFALIAAYAVAAVWGLARFALARGGVAPAAARRAGAAAAVGLALLAAAAAAPAFGLTPASPFEKWDFGPGRIEVGYTPDASMDLTRGGTAEETAEVAFSVTAERNGAAFDEVSADTRWRGRVLTHYGDGKWRRDAMTQTTRVAEPARWVTPWRPPALGPDAYTLRFAAPDAARSDFLAEPVVWRPGEPPPVADVFARGAPPRPWTPISDGTFLRSPSRADGSRGLLYVQHTAPLPDPDLGVGFGLTNPTALDPALTANPVKGVKAYADRLLADLVAAGQLPPAAAVLGEVRRVRPVAQHEAIARAFARHLGESDRFTYSLTTTRTRPDLDPLDEFLNHNPVGSCQRYASALVLMLRSQGVPAALVQGFKGHEPQGDGVYLVRQDRAHAWATALVARPGPAGGDVWHWLSLDPTPGVGTDGAAAATATEAGWKWIWDKLLDATPEERLKALAELAGNPVALTVLGGVLALGGLAWVVRRAARRTPAGAAAWFAPLYRVLAQHGFTPDPAETPLEFASRVRAALDGRAAAAVPVAWAEAYYDVRFGGTPVAPDRRAALDAGLAALRSALAASPPVGAR